MYSGIHFREQLMILKFLRKLILFYIRIMATVIGQGKTMVDKLLAVILCAYQLSIMHVFVTLILLGQQYNHAFFNTLFWITHLQCYCLISVTAGV